MNNEVRLSLLGSEYLRQSYVQHMDSLFSGQMALFVRHYDLEK